MDLKIDIFKKDCLSDFCVNGTEGEIRIGYYRETLYIPLDWWSMHKYQLQWEQGINRLRYYDKSCLVAAINNPEKKFYLEWWPLYKINGKIHIQNHIITNDICEKMIGDNLFTVETCYDFIPKYQSHTEDGIKISEWIIDWDGRAEK